MRLALVQEWPSTAHFSPKSWHIYQHPQTGIVHLAPRSSTLLEFRVSFFCYFCKLQINFLLQYALDRIIFCRSCSLTTACKWATQAIISAQKVHVCSRIKCFICIILCVCSRYSSINFQANNCLEMQKETEKVQTIKNNIEAAVTHWRDGKRKTMESS